MNQSYLEAIDLIWSAKGVAALMRATDAAAEHDGLFEISPGALAGGSLPCSTRPATTPGLAFRVSMARRFAIW